MKTLLASTAIALVLANGALAASHEATEGDADATMSTDTSTDTEAAVDPATDSAVDTDVSTEMDTGTSTDMEATTDTTATEPMTDTDTVVAVPVDPMTMTAPSMAMDGYVTVANIDLTAEELMGVSVYGIDDVRVGEIGNLVVADDGTVTDVIIDVGGFLGLGEKPVALPFDSVQILKQVEGVDMRAFVSATEAQLKELPEYEAPAVTN